ncbi:hypothetical protein FM076_15175 [Streptomyces albus subsp. chlorinus]|uniref:hypothetical protein n=1 Tax=Streptomyces albus TaxID=1888 RepID=UPI00156F4422|nr:hypothetical protein [Streptomyces albus subsp. chlorinus]
MSSNAAASRPEAPRVTGYAGAGYPAAAAGTRAGDAVEAAVARAARAATDEETAAGAEDAPSRTRKLA